MKEREYRLIKPKDRNIQVIFNDFPAKRYSTGTRDEYEAHQWAVEWLSHRGRGGSVPYFKDFAKKFFTRTNDATAFRNRDRARGVERSDNYYIQRQHNTDNYLVPFFGNMRLDAITSLEIEDFLYQLKGKRQEELSSAYKLSLVDTLSLIIRQACQLHIIDYNPCSKDYLALPVRKPVREIRALTKYERETLFPIVYTGGAVDVLASADRRVEVWDGVFFAAYFSVMLSTGFRPGEVKGIQGSDLYIVGDKTIVDISHSVPSCSRTLVERVKTSNSGYKTRTGYIDPVSAELIRRLQKERCLPEDGPLFIWLHNYVAVSTANDRFKTTCLSLGLEDAARLPQYCIRHTFGTLNKGTIPESVLADLMGHAGGHMQETYDNRDKMQRIAQVAAQSGSINQDKAAPLIRGFFEKEA